MYSQGNLKNCLTPITSLQSSGTEPSISPRCDCSYIAYVTATLFSLADYGNIFWMDLYIICELPVSAPRIS